MKQNTLELKPKFQLFLGSDEFIGECMKKASIEGWIAGIGNAQKYAGRPTLEKILEDAQTHTKDERNRAIHKAYHEYAYTLREIGQYIGMNPDYLSRMLSTKKKSESKL